MLFQEQLHKNLGFKDAVGNVLFEIKIFNQLTSTILKIH